MTSVAGNVMDTDYMFIPGVMITETTNYNQTITDDTGWYELKDLLPGTYILEADKIGYNISGQSVDVELNKVVNIDFILEKHE